MAITALVRSISRTDMPHEYEVVIEIDGREITGRCVVAEYDGIRVVQQKTEIITKLGFSPRSLVAAIIAFDAVGMDE